MTWRTRRPALLLAPGDRVRFKMRDGCDFEGRRARIGPDSLVVTRIVAVQRPYPSPTKSFLMGLGLTTVALMIVLLLALRNSTGWD